jgi:large subunit ribosomal protein L20
MPRTKRGVPAHKRHKKLLELAQGQVGARHRLFRPANEAVMRSLSYAYDDRRKRKRDMRALWITRINAACRLKDFTYSQLIAGLNKAHIALDRKSLAELAAREPQAFLSVLEQARAAL